MKTGFAAIVTIIMTLVFVAPLLAQPAGPGGDPDIAVPIDGGVSLLVVAGIAYGAKKAYDKRKSSTGDREMN